MCQLKCQKSQPTVKLKVPGETQKVGPFLPLFLLKKHFLYVALIMERTVNVSGVRRRPAKGYVYVWTIGEVHEVGSCGVWRGKGGSAYFRVANPSDLWGATISSSPSNELLLPIRNKYCHYQFRPHFLVAFDSTRGNLWPGWLSAITFLICSLKIFVVKAQSRKEGKCDHWSYLV